MTERPSGPSSVRRDPPIASAALFCALVVGGSNLAAIAAEAAFVATSSIREVAAFGLASAALRSVAALALAAGAERMSHDVVGHARAGAAARALLVAAGGSAIVAALLATRAERPALWLACLLPFALPALAPVVAFQRVTATLGPRSARRVLPKLAAAGTLGAIAAGAFGASLRGPAIAWIGLGAGGVALLAAALSSRIGAKGDDDATAGATTSGAFGEGSHRVAAPGPPLGSRLGSPLGPSLGSPLIRLVLALAVLTAALAAAVDLAFKLALAAQADPSRVGPLLGASHVVSNVLILALQLFATTRVVERLGMRGALGSAGMVAVVLGSLTAALPGLAASFALRFFEGAARYAFGAQVGDLLLGAAPAAARTRAKALAKGLAGPLGALLAGAVGALAAGASSSGVRELALLAVGLGLGIAALAARAPAVYADALRQLLRRPTVPLGDAAIAAHRAAVLGGIGDALRRGDAEALDQGLDLVDPRFFAPRDLAPLLPSAPPRLRCAIARRMAATASPATADVLLAAKGGDDDLETEVVLVAAAREHGIVAPRERLQALVRRGRERADDTGAAAFTLGASSLVRAAAMEGADPASKKEAQVALADLRRAARGAASADDDGPIRVRALEALATLASPKALPEIQIGLGSSHRAVFAAAARAALAIDAPGAVATLVRQLRAGPHVRVAGRALREARARAVRELCEALPVTRGESAVAPTAVASSRTVAGTVRAAQVVGRLGAEGATAALGRLGDLGFRARDAVVRAVARSAHAATLQTELVLAARLFVDVGEALDRSARATNEGPGLYRRELEARLASVRERLCDLAAAIDATGALARARGVLDGGGVRAEIAIELVEASLGREVGPRAARLLAREAAPASTAPAASPDGWLAKARAYDAGELASGDPMRDVLDRVRVLSQVPLFAELSGEELYPVAEVAERVEHDAGEVVVAQGGPSDALFVVAAGRCEVVRDGARVGELEPGQAFGELGVLDGAPRSATVRALAACVLLRIPRGELDALLDESPELARSVIRHLVAFARRSG